MEFRRSGAGRRRSGAQHRASFGWHKGRCPLMLNRIHVAQARRSGRASGPLHPDDGVSRVTRASNWERDYPWVKIGADRVLRRSARHCRPPGGQRHRGVEAAGSTARPARAGAGAGRLLSAAARTSRCLARRRGAATCAPAGRAAPADPGLRAAAGPEGRHRPLGRDSSPGLGNRPGRHRQRHQCRELVRLGGPSLPLRLPRHPAGHHRRGHQAQCGQRGAGARRVPAPAARSPLPRRRPHRRAGCPR